jgi:hypothetical protein
METLLIQEHNAVADTAAAIKLIGNIAENLQCHEGLQFYAKIARRNLEYVQRGLIALKYDSK